MRAKDAGRALLDAALTRLAGAGLTQAWLTTGAGTQAERYQRHGWRDMGRGLDGLIVFVKAI